MGAKVSQDMVFVLQSEDHELYVSRLPPRSAESDLPTWSYSLSDAKIWRLRGPAKNAAEKLERRTAHKVRIVRVTITLAVEWP